MTKVFRVMAWAFSLGCVVACGGAAAEPASPSSAGGPTPAPATAPATSPTTAHAAVDEQVAAGAKLYVAHCAGCHGDSGEGNAKAPAVVGKNALPLDPQPPSQARKAKFRTALDVFQFVKATMPPKTPGSLTDEQYAAIMAFDLKANGVDLGGRKIDATSASTFVLHP